MLTATVLLFAISACKKDDGTGNNNTGAEILPGIGLRDVKIGDTAQKAFDVFGSTPDSYFEVNGEYTHSLIYFSKGLIIFLEPTGSDVLDLNTRIKTINLSGPYTGKTEEGIGIGSTRADVNVAFGQPNITDATSDTYLIKGINFAYDAAGNVESIEILKI